MNKLLRSAKDAIRPVLLGLLLSGLILSLAGAPTALMAAAKRGADVQVILVSPGMVSGELIGINAEKIVLQVGAIERTITLAEVDTVRVFKETREPLGIAVGLVAGGLTGYAVGKQHPNGTETEASSSQWVGAALGALVGAAAGWGIGKLLSKPAVYEIRGVTPEKLNATIESLSKKARVPSFK